MKTNTNTGASAPFDIAQQLGSIASATPADKVVVAVEPPRRASRFFFTLDEPIEERKKKFTPKKLTHVDHEVTERTRRYKSEVPPALRSKIEMIREFFLTEIAPITMAASGGTGQAKQVVERFLDDKVDTTLLAAFENMSLRAAKIKLSLFVLELFDLDKQFLDELSPRPTESNGEKSLQKVLNTIMEQLAKQDQGINVLTNQLKKRGGSREEK